MRVSRFFISTLKEAPSEAELPSHRLMLRAGYIRKLCQRPLYLDAIGTARAAQSRSSGARRDGQERRHRVADARRATRRTVAGDRTLGSVRPANAEDQGPAQQPVLFRPYARRGHHRHRAPRSKKLSPVAAEFLPDPDQVPRRSAPAFRRDARARVRDEGCVFFPQQLSKAWNRPTA